MVNLASIFRLPERLHLALLYETMGDYGAAVPLCRQVLEIHRTVLGKTHPGYATSLGEMATLLVATDHATEAMTLMAQAAVIDDAMIGQVFSMGSERQRTVYLETIWGNFDAFLSLVSQHLPHSPETVRSGFDLVLRRKAITAEALAVQRDAVLGGRYPTLAPQLKELATLRMQIAQKILAGPGPEGVAAHQALVAAWQTQQDRLESELARQIPEMHLTHKLRAADRQLADARDDRAAVGGESRGAGSTGRSGSTTRRLSPVQRALLLGRLHLPG